MQRWIVCRICLTGYVCLRKVRKQQGKDPYYYAAPPFPLSPQSDHSPSNYYYICFWFAKPSDMNSQVRVLLDEFVTERKWPIPEMNICVPFTVCVLSPSVNWYSQQENFICMWFDLYFCYCNESAGSSGLLIKRLEGFKPQHCQGAIVEPLSKALFPICSKGAVSWLTLNPKKTNQPTNNHPSN